MKMTYKSIKAYTSTMATLEVVRYTLRLQGIYLNKAQTLNLGIEQLKRTLEKMDQVKNGII